MAKKPSKSTTSTAVTGAMAPANLPAGVTVKRHVTLPSLAIKTTGQAEIVTIVDPIRVSKITQKKAEGEKATREPANICSIHRHAGTHNDKAVNGVFTFIVPAVVKANLERDYPTTGDGEVSYIGKSFFIRNMGKRTEAQRYNDFEIYEVDVAPVQAAA